MALIQVTLMSSALHRTVPVTVILPADKLDEHGNLPAERCFPALYLLHGVFGSCIDWVSGTRIQRWAEERNLAVVMPSGDNAFYTDDPETCSDYGRFVGEELVTLTRRMFPLSRRREDTSVAGLSMGGFGALVTALRYPQTFGHAAGLSPALVFEEDYHLPYLPEDALPAGSLRQFRHIFGDLSDPASCPDNPRVLLARLLDAGIPLPRLYLACGTEDPLCYGVTKSFLAFLREKGVPCTYEEGPGAHEWDFWDRMILRVLNWLPLDSAESGMNSGHVLPD